MSLRNLVEREFVTIYQPSPTADDSGGPVQVTGTTTISTGGMRIDRASSRMVEAYSSSSIVMDHIGYTFMTGAQVGMYVADSAGSTYRITGCIPMKGMGTIETLWEITLQQVRS